MPEVSMLREGLWLVEASVEDFDVRAVVVAGQRRAVVWDTLAHPTSMTGLPDLVSGLDVTVVYSHADWDHVWGTAGLPPEWTDIIGHDACAARFAEELPAALAQKRAETPGAYHDVVLRPPVRTFRNSLYLDLGGLAFEVHHLPGHTLDSVVGFIPEWGVFLAGDAAEAPVPFLNPESPLGPWVNGLAEWCHRLKGGKPDPIVVPAHGPVSGPELLHQNTRYLRALMAGREPVVSQPLGRFYRSVHHRNLALAGLR